MSADPFCCACCGGKRPSDRRMCWPCIEAGCHPVEFCRVKLGDQVEAVFQEALPDV